MDNQGIDYILAKYESDSSLEEDGGWKTAKAEFNLKNAYREKSRYGFLLSVPGASQENFLEVDKIEIRLSGRTLLEKLKDFFKR